MTSATMDIGLTIRSSVEDYLKVLSSQSSAGINLSSAYSELVSKQEESKPFNNSEETSKFEANVLDQSYISLKLQNAFDEVDQQLDICKKKIKNVSLSSRKGTQSQKRGNEKDCHDTSCTGKEVTQLVLALVKELYEYHKAVSDHLAPLVEFSVREKFSEKHEAKECSSVPVAWKAVSEITRSLRYGYGLSSQELSNILAWMHGEDLSESARKLLNQRIDNLIHTYEEKMFKFDAYEVDVPIAFHIYPLVLQDVLKDCCNSVESRAAIGQNIPSTKEELETLIHREIPRIQVDIDGVVYDVSNPGKAFENTKQKMHAVRDLVSGAIQSHMVGVNKEQLDLFCLRVLATACVSVSNAASRTAVLMAFGKANLVQVKPFSSKNEELKYAQISESDGAIEIDVPSQWSLVEDGTLFASLCRGDTSSSVPLAMVETTYRLTMDFISCIEKRVDPLPVVHLKKIQSLNTQLSNKVNDIRDNNSKNLRKRFSKATSKLFNRRSFNGLKQETDQGDEKKSRGTSSQENVYTESKEYQSDKDDDGKPVPPPRPRRKARKKKKVESVKKVLRPPEEAKKDKDWFASTPAMFKPHLVPKFKVDSKASPSVASFEELHDVIEFLSGSSTSSLCLSQVIDGDKNIVARNAQKERDSQTSTDDKGKTSPVDSGIGSLMSVQSSLSAVSQLSFLSQSSGTPAVSRKKRREKMKGVEGKDKLVGEGMNQMLAETPEDDTETSEHDRSEMSDKQTPDFESTSSSCDENKDIISNSHSLQNEDTEISREDVEVIESFNSVVDSFGGETCTSISENKEESMETAQFVEFSSHDGNRKLDEFSENSNERIQDVNESPVFGPPSPDQQSYDADDSDEEDDTTALADDESRHGSSSTLRGSTESLYYSAWSLNDLPSRDKESPKEQLETSVATGPETMESLIEASVDKLTSEKDDSNEHPSNQESKDELHDGDLEYKPFTTRYSWSAEIGNRLAAIWGGGKESTEPVVSAQGDDIWSSRDTTMTIDKQMDLQNLLEGSSWNKTERPSSTPSLPWKARNLSDVDKGSAGSSPTVATTDQRWMTPPTTSTRYGDVWQQGSRHNVVAHRMEAQPRSGMFHQGSTNFQEGPGPGHVSHLSVGHRGWTSNSDSRGWSHEYPLTNQPFRPSITPPRPQSTPSLHISPGRNAADFDPKCIPRVPSPGFGMHAGHAGLAAAHSVSHVNNVSRYPEQFQSHQSQSSHAVGQSANFRRGHRRHSSEVLSDPALLAQLRAHRNSRIAQAQYPPGAWNPNNKWPQ